MGRQPRPMAETSSAPSLRRGMDAARIEAVASVARLSRAPASSIATPKASPPAMNWRRSGDTIVPLISLSPYSISFSRRIVCLSHSATGTASSRTRSSIISLVA